jgi:hypothetical protein
MKSNAQTLAELKRELIRIGSINQIGLKPARVLLPPDEMLKTLKGEFERLGSFKMRKTQFAE